MPDISLHHIKTQKTARYYTLGKLDSNTKHIWLVLHGYGQLAEYFIRNFKDIHYDHHFFIAPEGLSRFYLNETTGRVGATWMTKEDRENEIEDYLIYLDQILNSIEIPADCKINLLGFSQGAATACRWLFHTPLPIKTLICWSGFFPTDMQWNSLKYLNDDMKTYLLYGNQDEYVTEELMIEMQKIIKNLQKKPNIITFEGGHEILSPTLYTLCKTIDKD